ncbi:MAG TPA: shikimate dehydrogenase [Terriglobales bacterium]|jgi:3-dehydroquinate dehydratase/shikimate dehydrogenase|nr:shikimate dehydrogenase [Terriglobales bacterium]
MALASSSSNLATRLLPQRLPRVCLAISGDTVEDQIAIAESMARDNPFLEFRLDYLKQPLAALSKIHRFLETHQYITAVGTCRRTENGGKFKGTLAAQLEVLTKAHAAGCQIVDLELQSAAKAKPDAIARLRSRAGLILSFHDFRATRNLDETLEKMLKIPADFYKIVGTATTLADNVAMMKFLQAQSGQHALVGLCMGEQGVISRVLGVRAGSVFTFGAVNEDLKTAPGQISARDLRNIYRIDQVDAATRIYGVAGDPVEHSLSPIIMNTALRRENVNAVYLPLHAKTMKDLMQCVSGIPLHGMSITMPYKQSILTHLDNTDAHTTKVGACNTVVRGQEGKLYGFNTDIAGVLRPLEQRIAIDKAKVLVLGAGGAARAAVFGLKERGAEVWVMNRTSAKGQKLARQAKAHSIKRADLKKVAFDVIINATPVGMGNTRDCPLKEQEIQARVVFDMVYDPVETRLLQIARAKGIAVIPGIEMFVQQAARQFEIWTGKPAPAADMLRAVTIALQERAAAQKQQKA